MKEILQMIIVLSLICLVCGLALSGYKDFTAERIEYQVLMNVQGPKVKKVLKGADNNLIKDRKEITVNGRELLVFIGKKDNQNWAVAYETLGTGFGGNIKVMVGYDIKKDKLTGIQIISHSETPGIGAKITKEEFTKRFRGLETDLEFSPKDDGGDIDALSGATYSTRGVCEAIRKSIALLPQVKNKAF